jgi:hypothetical protein
LFRIKDFLKAITDASIFDYLPAKHKLDIDVLPREVMKMYHKGIAAMQLAQQRKPGRKSKTAPTPVSDQESEQIGAFLDKVLCEKIPGGVTFGQIYIKGTEFLESLNDASMPVKGIIQTCLARQGKS